ncbi:MAG: outer membrane beta-barrel protein [Nitrospirota bacterium]
MSREVPSSQTRLRGEWYVGGYGGIANPGAFSNVTISDPTLAGGVTNARINDLELKGSFVGGAKGGYFFEERRWLGLEMDVYSLKPNVKSQTVVGGTPSGRVFADNIGTIPLRLTTWAVNIIIRSPSLDEVFQPYGGMGYGLFFANTSNDGLSDTRVSPGFNLIAGARYALTPQWAFFGEFKFNRATIRFSDIRGNYDSQLFVFGLMWHNREKY